MVLGHIRYKRRTNKPFRYFCPNCSNYFNVIYHTEITPLKNVECPFCKNNFRAFIIINHTPLE